MDISRKKACFTRMLQGKKSGFRVDVSRKIKEKPVLKWMFPIKKACFRVDVSFKRNSAESVAEKIFF